VGESAKLLTLLSVSPVLVYPRFTVLKARGHDAIKRPMLFHIIDDQPVICAHINELLGELGHSSRMFFSPVDYLEFLNDNSYIKPDAIFTDISMPTMGGYEMIRRVQMVYPDQRFVIVSGKPEIRNDFKDREEWLFLNKPFQSENLYNVLAKLDTRVAA
jgi:two-component SAPR family response regulator